MNTKQKNLDGRFSFAGENSLKWRRMCELLLPEIEKLEVWKACGFGSIYEYAAKKAGMSRNKVNECLRILRRVEDKPALMEVVRKKGVLAVKPVATIATQESEEFWAEKAEKLGKNSLETYVREVRKEDARPRTAEAQVTLTINPQLAKRLEQFKKREDAEKLLEKFLDSLEEEKPEVVEAKSRHIPVRIKRFVLKRTGEKCAFPGCNRQYETLHHTQRYALEKVHDPDRLVPLCLGHERLFHEGLVENEDGPADGWSVREQPDKTSYKFYVDEMVRVMRHNAVV